MASVEYIESGFLPNQGYKRNKFCLSYYQWIVLFIFISACIALAVSILAHNNTPSERIATYDFIVIGSGPAGSVVASRVASRGYTVLLLESGNTTQVSLNGTFTVSSSSDLTLFDIPLEWDIITVNDSYTSQYIYAPKGSTVPQCGRGIGGSGSINAMIYIRGTISDFSAQNGWIDGWNNYTNILKYYMRSENNSNMFQSAYHNNSGDVHISYNFNYKNNTLSNTFLAACAEKEYSVINDMNEPDRSHNICGNYQFLISDANNRNQTMRYSVARAFYGNNIKPKTLNIKPNAMAVNLIFDDEDKQRAVGVKYVHLSETNTIKTVYAKKEIIISAGTLNTPTILMQSGIGDEVLLRENFQFKDEDIILNNSHVGQHYIDGVFTYVQWNVTDDLIDDFSLCTPWGSMFDTSDNVNENRCKLQWEQYMDQDKRENTVFDTTGFDVGGFFKSPFADASSSNDIQITLQPFDIVYAYNKTNILTAQIANNLPFSRGYLQWNHLNHVHDLDNIVVDGSNIEVIGNYLQDERDINALVFGINVTRDIFGSNVMSEYLVNELVPGYNVSFDDALKKYVVENKQSADHIVGTAKLGFVVNEELKVIGLKNVRIADASIMPSLPSGNTHATCMMIGEYAAELILAQYDN